MFRHLPPGDWMIERGLNVEKLVAATGLDEKVIEAIIFGRYTPSPEQRERVSAVLGVHTDQVMWGHTCQVDHMYGHGPQFGRSP